MYVLYLPLPPSTITTPTMPYKQALTIIGPEVQSTNKDLSIFGFFIQKHQNIFINRMKLDNRITNLTPPINGHHHGNQQ